MSGNSTCKWTHAIEGEGYNTSCGKYHVFTEGNTVANEFWHCPYCGKDIRERPAEEIVDDGKEF